MTVKGRPKDLDDGAASTRRHTNAAQEKDEKNKEQQHQAREVDREEEEDDEEEKEEEDDEEEEDEEEEEEEEDELVADHCAEDNTTNAAPEEDSDTTTNAAHKEDMEDDKQDEQHEPVEPQHNTAQKEDTEQDEHGKHAVNDADEAAQQVLCSNGTTEKHDAVLPAAVEAILVKLELYYQDLRAKQRATTHNGGNKTTFTRIRKMVSYCIMAALNETTFGELLSGPNLLENLMTADVALFMVDCCSKTRKRGGVTKQKSGNSLVTDLTRLKAFFKMGQAKHTDGPTAVYASLDVVNDAIQQGHVRADADRVEKRRSSAHGSALQQTSAFPLGDDEEQQQHPQCALSSSGTMLERTIDCSHHILQHLKIRLKAWKQQNHKLNFRKDNQVVALICYVIHTLAFPSQRTAVILSLKFGIPGIDACDEENPHFVYYCQKSRQWRITQARSKTKAYFGFLPIPDQIGGLFTEYMEFWKVAALDFLPTCDPGGEARLEPAASDMLHVFGGARGPKNGPISMKTVLKHAQEFGTALSSLGKGRHAWANHNSSLDSESKLVKSYAQAHGTSLRYYQDSNVYATENADNAYATHAALCDQRRLTFMWHFGKQFLIPENVHWDDSGIPQVSFQVAMPIHVNGSGTNSVVLMAYLQRTSPPLNSPTVQSDEYYLQPPSNQCRQNSTEPYFTLLRGSVAFAQELSGVFRWPYEHHGYRSIVLPPTFEATVLAALKSTTLQDLADYGAEAKDKEYVATESKDCPPPKKEKRPQRRPAHEDGRSGTTCSSVHKAAQWSSSDVHAAMEQHLLSCHKNGIRLANSRLTGGQIVLMKQTGNLASVRSGYTGVDVSSIEAVVTVVPMTPLEEQQVHGIRIDTWHAPAPRASPVRVAATDLSFPVDYVLSADGSKFTLRQQASVKRTAAAPQKAPKPSQSD